jgi:TPR repeat protein
MMKLHISVLSLLLLFTTSTKVTAQGLSTPYSSSYHPADDKEFFRSNFHQAQRGEAKAMGILGLLYLKGLGCGQDNGEALQWLKRGAQKGDADAQNNLGYLYFMGLGVKEDGVEALKWFTKAASQGLSSAAGNMGLLYARGAGVPKDYAKALEWFKKAAEQNDADSQVNLAQMLSLGQGSPKDWVESYKWFSLALKHPSLEDAQVADLRNDIEWLEKRMTGEEIAEAKKRAWEWNPSQAKNPSSK